MNDESSKYRAAMDLQSVKARYRELAEAAIAYDLAIQVCAGDPDKMSSYCTAQGDTLDSLYARWLGLAMKAAADPAGALADASQPAEQPSDGYYFRRFVGGKRRAEDVEVMRAKTLDEAMATAARICPHDREPTVLVLASQPKAATDAQVVAHRFVSDLGTSEWHDGEPHMPDAELAKRGVRVERAAHPAPSQAVGAVDDYTYQQLFNAIAAATVRCGTGIAVSVSAFREVLAKSTTAATQAVATDGDGVTDAAKALDAHDWFKDSAWDTGQLKAAKARMRRALRAALASPSAPQVGVPDEWTRALDAAVAAIYFADSSDYETALWQVVKHLKPDLVDLLQSDESAAYEQVKAMLTAAPEVRRG